MRLKNRQNYTRVIEVKKKKVVTCCGEGGYWLEQGMQELSEMMEMFSTFIQLQAARVCVCHWAVYLRAVHFTACKLYQKWKKKSKSKQWAIQNGKYVVNWPRNIDCW